MQDLAQRASKITLDHLRKSHRSGESRAGPPTTQGWTHSETLPSSCPLFALRLKWDSTLMADVCLYPKKGWDGIEGTL